MDASPTWFKNLTYNLLRLVAGFQIWQHGAQKLLAWFGRESPAEMWSIFWVAGVTEFFGGILLIFGLFTRPVAFLLSGQMAVAFFWRHAWGNPFWPTMNRGEPAVLFCFIFLLIFAWGSGTFSLDARRAAKAGSDDSA